MKDKLKGFFGGDDQPAEQSTDDAYYTTTKEEFHEQNGMAGSKMMLLEPRAYSESQQIADYLKNSNLCHRWRFTKTRWRNIPLYSKKCKCRRNNQ